MLYKISYQAACVTKPLWDDIDPKTHPLFIAASKRPDCSIYTSTSSHPISLKIIVNIPNIAPDVVGFMICVYKRQTNVYIAKLDSCGNITDGANICEITDNTSLDMIIDRAKAELNECPVCHKQVPYNNQKHFSFAGRCCENCLPEMKNKYEYPGWYD